MLLEGFQTLWERLLAATNAKVHLNAHVNRINRKPGAVEIYIDGVPETFEWLIMAAPMPDSLAMLGDITEEELSLFSDFHYHELVLSILNYKQGAGPIPKDFELLTWADRLEAQSDYYVMSRSSQTGDVARTMKQIDGDDAPLTIRHTKNILGFQRDVVGVLQISSIETSDAQLTELMNGFLAKYNLSGDLLKRGRWDYMPFKSLDDVVSKRAPWRMWDLQGQQSTWFVGSYASFESVADVLDYNMKLVNNRLCDPGSPSPSTDTDYSETDGCGLAFPLAAFLWVTVLVSVVL